MKTNKVKKKKQQITYTIKMQAQGSKLIKLVNRDDKTMKLNKI